MTYEDVNNSWLSGLLIFWEKNLVRLQAEQQKICDLFRDRAVFAFAEIPKLKPLDISMIDEQDHSQVTRTIIDIIKTAEEMTISVKAWVQRGDNNQFRAISIAIAEHERWIKDICAKLNDITWPNEFHLWFSAYKCNSNSSSNEKNCHSIIPLFRNGPGHMNTLRNRKDFREELTSDFLGFVIMVCFEY